MSNDIKDIYSRNLDILSEIGNIGAGNATTALAQIIGNKVNMDVPQVRLLGFNELTEIVGGAENIVIGIMCRIEGDLTGMMMFMLEKAVAHHLIDIVMMGFDDGSEEEFSEMKARLEDEINSITAKIEELSTQDNNSSELFNEELVAKTLESFFEFSPASIDKSFVDKFVYQIIQQDDDHFIWILNLLPGKKQSIIAIQPLSAF